MCEKCIFAADKELEKMVVNRELCLEIDRAVARTLTKLRNIKAPNGASTILEMFASPFRRLEEVFEGKKKVQVVKLREYLSQMTHSQTEDLHFVWVCFRTGHAVFKQLLFKPMWK